jgi:hypothetical protein
MYFETMDGSNARGTGGIPWVDITWEEGTFHYGKRRGQGKEIFFLLGEIHRGGFWDDGACGEGSREFFQGLGSEGMVTEQEDPWSPRCSYNEIDPRGYDHGNWRGGGGGGVYWVRGGLQAIHKVVVIHT